MKSIWARSIRLGQFQRRSKPVKCAKTEVGVWLGTGTYTAITLWYFVFFWNTFGISNIDINVFHHGLKIVLSAPSLFGFRFFLVKTWRWIDLQSIAGWWLKHVNHILYFAYSFLRRRSHTQFFFKVEGANQNKCEQPWIKQCKPTIGRFHVRWSVQCVGLWTHSWNQHLGCFPDPSTDDQMMLGVSWLQM